MFLGKKGVELWISYVLLVMFTVAMASMVFIWMKNYAQGSVTDVERKVNTEKCEQISFTVEDAYFVEPENAQTLYIKVTNKNYLRIDKIILRENSQSGSENIEIKKVIKPSVTYEFETAFDESLGPISIDMIPVYIDTDSEIVCQNRKVTVEYQPQSRSFR